METLHAVDQQINKLFGDDNGSTTAKEAANGNGALDSLVTWVA